MSKTKHDELPTTYEAMRDLVKAMPHRPLTDSERADWAFGNTAIENPAITREMARHVIEQLQVNQE